MGPEPGTDGTISAGPPRGATYAHLLTLVGAFAFWAWWDRDLWFFGDEWDFLVQRALALTGQPGQHLVPPQRALVDAAHPAVAGLFNVFHLSSYWPYIVPVLVLQIGVMHLCWRLSLRAGVRPWVAVAAVGLLGFLGAGAEDLTWAFQVGFVGSVFFGLLAIELLDGYRPRAAGAGAASCTPASPCWPASCARRSAMPCWWRRPCWRRPGCPANKPCG